MNTKKTLGVTLQVLEVALILVPLLIGTLFVLALVMFWPVFVYIWTGDGLMLVLLPVSIISGTMLLRGFSDD